MNLEWHHKDNALIASDGQNEYRISKKQSVVHSEEWNLLEINGQRRGFSPSIKDMMDAASLVAAA